MLRVYRILLALVVFGAGLVVFVRNTDDLDIELLASVAILGGIAIAFGVIDRNGK